MPSSCAISHFVVVCACTLLCRSIRIDVTKFETLKLRHLDTGDDPARPLFQTIVRGGCRAMIYISLDILQAKNGLDANRVQRFQPQVIAQCHRVGLTPHQRLGGKEAAAPAGARERPGVGNPSDLGLWFNV